MSFVDDSFHACRKKELFSSVNGGLDDDLSVQQTLTIRSNSLCVVFKFALQYVCDVFRLLWFRLIISDW